MHDVPGHGTRDAREPGAPLLAVAGLSARTLAASARRAGFRVAALDCFGDRDTREHAQYWYDIAAPGALRIDKAALRDALDQVAVLDGAFGWVAGGGLESMADEAEQLSTRLRFFGNAPEAVRAVREPRRFFGLLDELGIAHPATRLDMPAQTDGWLFKQTAGCGGWHIEPAGRQSPRMAKHGYFQQRREGVPMSAVFIANARQAAIVGFALQRIETLPDCPFVYAGATAPVPLADADARAVQRIADAIVARTGLVGLNGIDFLLDGNGPCVLEVNPRPTASVALYEEADSGRWPRGLMGKHLEACMTAPRAALPGPVAEGTVAHATFFAKRALRVSAGLSDALAGAPWCADVPRPGTGIVAGHPLCTMVARAASPGAAEDGLDGCRTQIEQWLGAFAES